MQVKINCIIGKDYPLPIVEFKSSYKIAKDRIKQIRRTNSFRTVSDQVFKELGSRKKKAKRSRRKFISNQLSFDI